MTEPRSSGVRPVTGSKSPPSLLMVATVSGTIRHFLLPYAQYLRSRGWRVAAAASGATSDAALLEAFDAVHELPLSRSILDVAGLVRGIRSLQAILATQPAIVHVHTPIAAFVTRAVVRRIPDTDRPSVIYTAHGFHFHDGGSPLVNAVFLTAERMAGRWTDRLVVINDEDHQAARRHRIVPPRRLVKMPGIGIDTDFWAPEKVLPADVQAFREDHGIAADTPMFVILGELNRNKRQADAIRALAGMRSNKPHLMLLGRGTRRLALEREVQELGLADRVHFLGFVQDVRPAVRAATALILPSKREGLARSIMESLALEVPVIASVARGNREIVGPDSGIIVSVGDVAGLAAAMERLAEDATTAELMGRRGRQRMIEMYDLKILIRMHETVYEEMLVERQARMRRARPSRR